MKNHYLKRIFSTYPIDYAQAAFNKKYYLEAIQLLHSWIESKLRELIILTRHGNLKGGYKDIWKAMYELSYTQLSKALYVSGKINKSKYEALTKFNSLRNKIIHKLFYETWEKGVVGIPLSDLKSTFKIGKKVCIQIENTLPVLATRGKVRKN